MIKKALILLSILASLPLFAQRQFVECQNMAVNGGEKPKWIEVLFEQGDEKKTRKLLDIGKHEKIFFEKLEGENLSVVKSGARQLIYRKASGNEGIDEKDYSAVINALHNVADFWVLEKDTQSGKNIYIYYTVYSMK